MVVNLGQCNMNSPHRNLRSLCTFGSLVQCRHTRGSACTIYAAVQLVSLFRYALDSATGAVLWKVTVADNIGSSPSIGNNGMLYAAADSTLYAFAGK